MNYTEGMKPPGKVILVLIDSMREDFIKFDESIPHYLQDSP